MQKLIAEQQKNTTTKHIINKIMNKFECSECGTKYSSPETTPPPGIKWSDGHVCTPKPVKNE